MTAGVGAGGVGSPECRGEPQVQWGGAPTTAGGRVVWGALSAGWEPLVRGGGGGEPPARVDPGWRGALWDLCAKATPERVWAEEGPAFISQFAPLHSKKIGPLRRDISCWGQAPCA